MFRSLSLSNQPVKHCLDKACMQIKTAINYQLIIFLDNYQLISYSEIRLEVIGMATSSAPSSTKKVQSPQNEVQDFLDALKTIMKSPDFNLEKDLDILPRKSNESPTDPYTTQNTLLDLEYDSEDVRDRLLELTVTDYTATVIDNKDATLPPFYEFFKEINSRDVYIKVKIRDRNRKKIFCVSFHYARFPAPPFPYG